MRLLKPSFEILTPDDTFAKMIERIEVAGRVCYKSEDRIDIGSAMNFLRVIIDRNHESVIEHESVSVRIICDRGVSHEIVRHRLASYSQESTRYCNYRGGIAFIIPPWVNIQEGEYTKYNNMATKDYAAYLWLMQMITIEKCYQELMDNDWSPQMARSVLPNSLKTEIVMSCNLREWKHFFKLRTSEAAHPQMREIAIPMLKEFQTRIPIIFGDIVVSDKAADYGNT